MLPDHSEPPDSEPSDSERVRRVAIALAALAQDGAAFAQDPYDLSRYEHVADLAAELLSVLSTRPPGELRVELGRDRGYATPKVDVRGVLVDDAERVLLLRERSDGRWSLPGGWADPWDTPSAAVEREVLEETGHPVEATRLIACWDRDTAGHTPKLAVAVYKLFFLCRPLGPARPPQELETLEIGWFGVDGLPPLSPGRVTERQLRVALEHHRDPVRPVAFD